MGSGSMKDAQHHESSGKCKSKPQWDINSYLSACLLSKKQQMTSISEDMEKREHLCTVGENVNWCSHYGKQYGDFSKKLKIEPPFCSVILLLCLAEKNENTNWKVHMHTDVHCSIIYSSQIMKHNCPLIDEWIKKIWHINQWNTTQS